MNFDPHVYPYASKRNVVYAQKGMVATSQPLAAQAGIDILKKGGNAVDAAIAVAACLTVVEPTSNGIGGDAFALVWVKEKLYGLNASGPAPQGISIDKVKQAGYEQIQAYGWIPVTVPGAPAAWGALAERFGNLPLSETLQPAIEYAEQGYPVSPTLAHHWKVAFDTYKKELKEEHFQAWFDTFAPEGRAPKAGELWRSADHANTLKSIAESNGKSFYQGELAEKIDQFSRSCGGYLRKEDLAGFLPEWVTPISVNYRGYDVWEIPPNGQGLVALMALNILQGFEFSSRYTVDTLHKQMEAIKLAFADGLHAITQADKMQIPIDGLLSAAYADERRSLIHERALTPVAGEPPKGGTVYLATADQEGNMVSFIQSNYMGFGSGLVVPGTGIALHNRGHNFTLDENHVNRLEPGKKTYHTIIPGFLTKDGKAVGPFGVMGAFMQPQGHVQVLMNMIDFHLNPQAALDAPRWRWIKDKIVELESSVPEHLALALAEKGHQIQWALGSSGFGRGQIIIRSEQGVLAGGTEPRTDGAIAVW
ncbi:gamma-glutamyltransferase family protein [Ammoniphilus sp. YIM 78166]|uniref:gamma-glutamyltransferase family protein n=1 Tax=Ammoniphilus sp. YIM 78166 TaxID=1644106 RepID=UPI00106F91B1|nr:gamma-glutamyltransferase family protein [Ammoniphilus sp. YIM 78166]